MWYAYNLFDIIHIIRIQLKHTAMSPVYHHDCDIILFGEDLAAIQIFDRGLWNRAGIYVNLLQILLGLWLDSVAAGRSFM